MLRNKYAEPVKNAYNVNVHLSTGTHPFDIILSRTPPEFTLHYDDATPPPTVKTRADFVEKL